jgi:hypothetical protein
MLQRSIVVSDFIKRTSDRIIAFTKPPQYFSWQTIILLGLFSWAMSWIATWTETTAFTRFLLSNFSWIFFTIGVGWGLERNRVKLFGVTISPWVMGGMVCLFGLSPWMGDDFAPILVLWPLVSFLIAAIPHFLTWEMTLRLPPVAMRQDLVLLLVINLLFSSWFQFYFRLQTWADNYPSLMADDFSRSGFVYNLPDTTTHLSRGVPLLDLAETEITAQLDGMPWPRIERWLLNLPEQLEPIDQEVRASLANTEENEFWQIMAQPYTTREGYELRLMTVWQGPTSQNNGYYIEKSCFINPVSQPRPESANTTENGTEEEQPELTAIAQVNCPLETQRNWGRPQLPTAT